MWMKGLKTKLDLACRMVGVCGKVCVSWMR